MDGHEAWSFLREFRWEEPGGERSWDSAVELISALRSLDGPLRQSLHEAFRRWDAALGDIGGDPLGEDWTRFRPLRLSREEDWSDWLAWLLETSATGAFAARLFERSPSGCIAPHVAREVTARPHRLDLLIEWSDPSATSPESCAIEVKVGDRRFAKTAAATTSHETIRPLHSRADWILVPPEDREDCAVAAVEVMSWEQVAASLRQALRAGEESVSWRVWARALLGNIEQTLLGFPHRRAFDTAFDIVGCVTHLERTYEE